MTGQPVNGHTLKEHPLLADGRGSLIVPLEWVAGGSFIVAVGAVVALVVVSANLQADSLSVVALALAVIALVVQLIVFIVQAKDSGQQSAERQSLHGRTMEAVVEIQERARSTEAAVDSINTRLLEAILGKVASEGLGLRTPGLASRIAGELDAVSATSPTQPDGSEWAPPLSRGLASELHAEMSTWPPVGDQQVRSDVLSMSLVERDEVQRLALDLLECSSPDSPIGPGVRLDLEGSAIRKEFVEEVAGFDLYTLSARGRQVGRIFTAAGDAGVWASLIRRGPD